LLPDAMEGPSPVRSYSCCNNGYAGIYLLVRFSPIRIFLYNVTMYDYFEL